MSMAATASMSRMAREEGSSPLLLSPRALRLPVAASLFMHVSVAAILLTWWQASGTNAPQGELDGLSLTFIELAAPAPSEAKAAVPAIAAAAAPQPEEFLSEPALEAVPLPEPVAVKPERKPAPQPRIGETQQANAKPATASQATSPALSDARDGEGEGTAFGLTQSRGEADEEIIITGPRYRTAPRPPVYPRRARDLGQEGTAMVRVKLDHAGNPAEVSLLESSGYALLDHAAIRAARGWQFEPERRGGRPVAAFVHIPVRFALN